MKTIILLFAICSLISCTDKEKDDPCIVSHNVLNYNTFNLMSETSTKGCDNFYTKDKFDTINFDLFRIGLNAELTPLDNFQCDPIVKIIDSTKNIIITTNKDYNNQFKKGDTINSIVSLIYYEGNQGEQICTPIMLDDYLANKTSLKSNYTFFFTAKPNASKNINFTFYIKSNNKTFISFTDTINLKIHGLI